MPHRSLDIVEISSSISTGQEKITQDRSNFNSEDKTQLLVQTAITKGLKRAQSLSLSISLANTYR